MQRPPAGRPLPAEQAAAARPRRWQQPLAEAGPPAQLLLLQRECLLRRQQQRLRQLQRLLSSLAGRSGKCLRHLTAVAWRCSLPRA